MALLIQLFTRKLELVKKLQRCNDEADKALERGIREPSKNFTQVQNWIALQLQITNSIIEPVLSIFRVRMIKEEHEPTREQLKGLVEKGLK